MQRKSLTASKSVHAISERRKSLSKILIRQKSTTMIVHKINSSKTSNHIRLVGGADVSEEPDVAEKTLIETSTASIQEVSAPPPPTALTLPSSEKRFIDSLPVEKSTRSEITDNKSHEDKQHLSANGPCCFCVSQTLRSVGDRKVDEIIEYVHQNLEEAGKALATLGENFEHDLKLMFIDILGRIKQWTGIVQNKLDACKNEIGNLRKELLARACEMDVKTREMEDLKVQITDYQNALQLNGESLKKDNIKVRPEQEEEKIRKKIHAEEFLAEDAKEIKNPKIKDTVRTVDQIKEEDEENNAESAEAINHQETVRDAKEIDRTKKNVIKNPIKNTLQAADQIDEEVKRAIDMAAPTTLQEKTKREFELESEITQLRKEYDRVIKERAEYENAIQRALLRGVSSLNVEALRVLRCPPIPCCAPCAPCPATAGIIPTEPVVLCPAKNAKRRSGSAAATASSAKVPRDRNGDQTDCTTKWPCASPCCLAGRNRKSANGSMIFLLRQGNGENLYDEDTTPVCGSTVVKKIELPPLRKFET